MIIQILLIAGIVCVFVWFLANPRSHQVNAWIKILTFLFAVLAVVVILSPNMANDIAHWVGVGRGADLLLYLMSLAFIFTLVNIYTKNKEEQKRFVQLARKVALLEAEQKYKNEP